MTIIELSIFSNKLMSEVKKTEDALSAVEQRMTVVKAQLKTLNEILPTLKDDSVWFGTYNEIERLHIEELTLTHERKALWALIKTRLVETGQKPDCPVFELRSLKA
jgi:seryl-tRNA synthetase